MECDATARPDGSAHGLVARKALVRLSLSHLTMGRRSRKRGAPTVARRQRAERADAARCCRPSPSATGRGTETALSIPMPMIFSGGLPALLIKVLDQVEQIGQRDLNGWEREEEVMVCLWIPGDPGR